MTTTYDTSKTISEIVTEAGGIAKVSLGQLRAELGYQRIGRHVLGKMGATLNEESLGFFPLSMLDPEANPEPRQWQEVWIYNRDGSAKTAILDAVADPENHDLVAALSMIEGKNNLDFKNLTADQRLSIIKACVENV